MRLPASALTAGTNDNRARRPCRGGAGPSSPGV